MQPLSKNTAVPPKQSRQCQSSDCCDRALQAAAPRGPFGLCKTGPLWKPPQQQSHLAITLLKFEIYVRILIHFFSLFSFSTGFWRQLLPFFNGVRKGLKIEKGKGYCCKWNTRTRATQAAPNLVATRGSSYLPSTAYQKRQWQNKQVAFLYFVLFQQLL